MITLTINNNYHLLLLLLLLFNFIKLNYEANVNNLLLEYYYDYNSITMNNQTTEDHILQLIC